PTSNCNNYCLTDQQPHRKVWLVLRLRLNASANEKVQQAWINFIYTPVKPIDLGVEYVNGKRDTFDGKSYKDNRVGLMAKYSF
ncbi:DcaP family trimeric outer membrane transporter, partial [Acinetobacter baumannii]|uniref:DcaP family trimeric outer membrane transporter n=1 Tax=Acinetobacter baumannii TaxID=470 RepID=UPI00224C26A0